ncbi:GntR family transcriptional regulator [Octadecabacter antarcticus 307]|uniref:GntR family transcriptional regulator n=1 Tax=Octadecabacter antarcticus 307 TaxID=391626 RepID=M9RD77_9RHOB|nr:GntR family transcriptional regulator [Octadecabacter antarcticus]AGI69713.1 GntR family transcriptional regulator [Octadecabacter antarcticus 307]
MPDTSVFHQDAWFRPGRGSRYQQLQRHISTAILSGDLAPDDQLPPEREFAEIAQISRVTVRKAVSLLVADGLVEQRQGAGSFVRSAAPKLKQSLSSLVSFTENMLVRGMTSTSTVLLRGVFAPSPREILALGLSSQDRVTRIDRLRRTDDVPMAIEFSSLPQDILPDPGKVETSLYAVLRKKGCAPTRAVQRVTAINLERREAELLKLPEGSAVLKIERTGYLATGRPIEFTSGLYRSDIYDFVSELRRD